VSLAVAPYLSTSSSFEEIPPTSPSNPSFVDPSSLVPLPKQHDSARSVAPSSVRVGRGSRELLDPSLTSIGSVDSIDRSAVVSPPGAKASPPKPTSKVRASHER
jgi:hypothetical protein